MTAKEYLQNIKNLPKRIKSQEEKLEYIRAFATSIPSQLGRDFIAPNSSPSSSNKTENIVTNIIDLEQQILFDKLKYLQEWDKCNEIIKKIDENILAVILVKHYLLNKEFTKIAVELDYSYIRVLQLHKKALKEFERLYIIICQDVL